MRIHRKWQIALGMTFCLLILSISNLFFERRIVSLAIAATPVGPSTQPFVRSIDFHNQGLYLYSLHNYPAAISNFNSAIEISPFYAPPYLSRGQTYFELKILPNALQDFNTAISLDPDNALAYYSRAAVNEAEGQLDEAIADYSKAIELDPDHTLAYYRRGAVYESTGDFNAAIADYEKALDLLSQESLGSVYPSGALTALGDLYLAQDQYDEALASYERALTISRDIENRQGERDILTSIGSVYAAQDQYDNALVIFEQALSHNQEIGDIQGESDILANIGDVYTAQDQYDNALDIYLEVLALKREIGDEAGIGQISSDVAFIQDQLDSLETLSGEPQPEQNEIQQRIIDLREAALTESTPLYLPIPTNVEGRIARETLNIPLDFLPNASNLVFLNLGTIKIYGPNTMNVGETAIFSATLSLDPALISQTGTNLLTTTQSLDMKISRILHARLNGLDFEIQPSGNDTQPQLAAAGTDMQWSWQVRAVKSGQSLPLSVQLFTAALDEIENNSERMILLLPDQIKYLEVKQPLSTRLVNNQFLQNLILAVIGSSAVAAALIYFLDRKTEARLQKIEQALKRRQPSGAADSSNKDTEGKKKTNSPRGKKE